MIKLSVICASVLGRIRFSIHPMMEFFQREAEQQV